MIRIKTPTYFQKHTEFLLQLITRLNKLYVNVDVFTAASTN